MARSGQDVRGCLAADRHVHRVDRLQPARRGRRRCGRNDQLSALRVRAPVLGLLLNRARRHTRGHIENDLRIGPGGDVAGRYGDATDARRALGRAEAVVPRRGLLVVRRRRGRGPGISVVEYLLIAQRKDPEGMPRGAHPGPVRIARAGRRVAVYFADRGRRIRIGAIRVVVARTGEGRGRHDRRVHVLRLAGHERNFVAELAVGRVVQRVGNRPSRRDRSCRRPSSWAHSRSDWAG